MTLPPGPGYRTHIAKINSLYECSFPLSRRAAHSRGRSLKAGRRPEIFPLMVEGPLMFTFVGPDGRRKIGIENGSLTAVNPPTIRRLQYWKQASIAVKGRPDWLFIKLQCHGMDPRDEDAMLGGAATKFLRELIERAQYRGETLHFVTAREMTNIILAACDGHEGNPGEYRDYRLKRSRVTSDRSACVDAAQLALRN
jgi:hypothetical protein